jgi:integrase
VLALHTDRISKDLHEITVDRQFDRYSPWTDKTTIDQLMVPPKYDKTRVALVWPQYRKRLSILVDYANQHNDGWLFPRTRRQKWWAPAYEKMIERAMASMNVEHHAEIFAVCSQKIVPDWTWLPHYLRHFYGSYSLAAPEHGGLGWSVTLVQESMGHADKRTTESTYVHPVQRERESARTSPVTIPGL